MFGLWWIPIIAIVLLTAALMWRPRRGTARSVHLVQAKRQFHVQREWLEAKFIQMASAHEGPNAPRWADCMFADDVAYVRNRATGELSAFVAVTIAMEEMPNVSSDVGNAIGNLQAGTAVFRLDQDHWVTDGRALLNLTPNEAVARCGEDLELVSEELTHRA